MSIKNTTLISGMPNTIFSSTPNTGSIGASGASAVTSVYLCNIGATTLPVSVHAVPAGNTPDVSNIIYSNIEITPSDTYVIDTERLILDSGDSLAATTSANAAIVTTVIYVGI